MSLKIALLGDICLTGKYDLKNNPEALRQFDDIKVFLKGFDLVIANLESPLTDKNLSFVCKAIHIKSPLVNVEILKYLGVDAVSLANNHIFDFGYSGYASTISALQEAGIDYFGVEGREILLEKGRERILLGGFCCLSAHPSKANSKGVNVLNYESFRSFLERSRSDNAFPIASVHWGDENVHHPRKDHVAFSRLMAIDYDFLLHGNHPHVIQGVEELGKSLVAYSLGNFCTDEHRSRAIKNLIVKHARENQKSFVLSVDIESSEINSYDTIPVGDSANALLVMGEEERWEILNLSRSLVKNGNSHSRHFLPSFQGSENDSQNPPRFSVSWFLARLNYYFIGAFLKGLINRVRYRIIFTKIRKIAQQRNVA
ncbi:CapA family protein [Halomonas sp. H10-9-1]|uniref:CapA family protein n=1 Tax=Halomonas sp. H10-9-1 TaxID=2950871 RepID=UPI0032DFE3B7